MRAIGSDAATAPSVAVAAADVWAAASGVVSVPVAPGLAGSSDAAAAKAATNVGVPPALQSIDRDSAIASLNQPTKRLRWSPLCGG